jgi:hypothetical protein
MTPEKLVELYPVAGQEILTAGASDLIEKLGIETVRELVLGVMKGENLRNRTELLTRRKIAISSGSLIIFFLKGLKADPQFLDNLPGTALAALRSKSLSKEQKWIVNWILGLTDKAVQNVLRDDVNGTAGYHSKFSAAIKDVAKQLKNEFGSMAGSISVDSLQRPISFSDWNFVLHLLGAAGNQAMTIRGSDKSTYGKLFERLVLGSLLHILGFSLIDPSIEGSKSKNVFWLSERKEKRESDATALLSVGEGIRFDIGFIGRGNSEISLDKVSRFEREMQFGRKHYTMRTFIIVDRVGKTSRLPELAEKIDGTVVQMSMSYWPLEVAKHLSKVGAFKHPLIDMSNDSEIDAYLTTAIRRVPLMSFLPTNSDLYNEADVAEE